MEHQIKPEKFIFFIDKHQHETFESHMTVKRILVEFAKVDPEKNVLVLVHGNEKKEYHDLEETIDIHNGMKFTIFNQNPTPVS